MFNRHGPKRSHPRPGHRRRRTVQAIAELTVLAAAVAGQQAAGAIGGGSAAGQEPSQAATNNDRVALYLSGSQTKDKIGSVSFSGEDVTASLVQNQSDRPPCGGGDGNWISATLRRSSPARRRTWCIGREARSTARAEPKPGFIRSGPG